jgi:hypothetical protein
MKSSKRDGSHGFPLPWPGNINIVRDRRLAMKKELMLLALRFALFAAPVAITYFVSLEGYFG